MAHLTDGWCRAERSSDSLSENLLKLVVGTFAKDSPRAGGVSRHLGASVFSHFSMRESYSHLHGCSATQRSSTGLFASAIDEPKADPRRYLSLLKLEDNFARVEFLHQHEVSIKSAENRTWSLDNAADLVKLTEFNND